MTACHAAPEPLSTDDLDTPPADDDLVDFSAAARILGTTTEYVSAAVLAHKLPLWITVDGWRFHPSDLDRLIAARRRARHARHGRSRPCQS